MSLPLQVVKPGGEQGPGLSDEAHADSNRAPKIMPASDPRESNPEGVPRTRGLVLLRSITDIT
jgi:hypothetical protein